MNDSTTPAPGFSIVPNWMLHAEDVTGKMVLAYTALASFADRSGLAWPAMETLAARSKMAEGTLRQALRELQRLGLVEVQPRYREDGTRTSNAYVIRVNDTLSNPTGYPPNSDRGTLAESQGKQDPLEQAPSNEGAQRAKPRRPLPDDWEPSQAAREMAAGFGVDVEHEAAMFRAHATANDRRMVEWNGAFATWLGKARERSGNARKMTNAERGMAQAAAEARGGASETLAILGGGKW